MLTIGERGVGIDGILVVRSAQSTVADIKTQLVTGFPGGLFRAGNSGSTDVGVDFQGGTDILDGSFFILGTAACQYGKTRCEQKHFLHFVKF